MYSSTAFAFVASLSTALATPQGFNYASTFTSGAVKQQSDFQSEFTNAKGLAGTNGGFTSARLYTMIVSLPPPWCCKVLSLPPKLTSRV